MISNRGKKLKIICSLVILVAIAVMPLVAIGDSAVQAGEVHRRAPINPDFLEFWENPPETFYGYIPPPTDLSHLDEIPVERPRGFATLPSSFDWRTQGKVTSIKDQNPCGTCWVHGPLAAVESRVLIEESVAPEPDYSEQNLACCTDPAWVYLIGNRCMGGGWSWLAGDTLTKKGTRLEVCQPYNTGTIDTEACDDECDSIKMITDYRMIANQATSPDVIEPIKNAIFNHGPVSMAFYAEGEPWSHMHPGYIYYYPNCTENSNHIVSIVGWDDSIVWPGGGSGAWIVKNSWGTGWGDSGYFYLCYGSASMCEVASFDYKDYDANEQVYYWDEAGQVGGFGNWDDYSGWMANIFTSSQDGSLTHVDFWTTSNNAQYQIYVYHDGNISDGLQNQVASQTGTCDEFGYYSIPLSSPVSLTNDESFIVAVKMTTTGHKFPIPVEYQYVSGGTTIVDPTIQPGKSFYRHGDGESWIDIATQGCNACLRARVTSGAAGQPDITVSPTSFEKTLAPDITQDYTLNIGNVGDATLTYDISDVETTGMPAAAGSEKLFSQPASMVLEVPLEGSPIEPENTPEVGSGWQNIMTDGFEGAFPGTGWSVFDNGGLTDAYWGKDGYRSYSGSYSAFCAKGGTAGVDPPADYPDDMEAWMVYGPFSLADATDAELNFYYWLDSEYQHDYLGGMASVDGSSFYGQGWTGNSGGWVSKSFNLKDVYILGNLCGESQVWIAFIFTSDFMTGYEGAFVDDVVLRKYVGGAAEDTLWLDEEPKSGTVPPGGHDDITVTFDTTGLGSTYTADIIISSNDPDEPQVTVPVTLTVTTGVAPSVSIEPPSQTVLPGGTCDIDVWVDAGVHDLNGIDVAVQYNSNAMITSVADIEAHNLLGGLEIGPEVEEAAGVGEVTYQLASGTAVAGIDASVMTITFTMDAGAGPATYDLTVSTGTLIEPPDATEVEGVETNDGTVTVVIGRKGDFNGDDDIDIFDFVLFAAAYGSELGDDNYNAAGDFDDNGVINIFDFVQFAAVYGT